MASGISAEMLLDDIGENFLLCAICLENYKEPKLLPCLHRYCMECLNTFIEDHRDKLKCPLCQESFTVPTGGFKTDFFVNNITEYISLKKKINNEDTQTCYGCAKKLAVMSYCFKCNDFLCQACHHLHETNSSLKDHYPHLLALADVEKWNLSLEKLSSLKEAPRCNSHKERLSELCCKTCNNLLICTSCGIFGEHKGHNLHEVSLLAREERKRLNEKVAALINLEKKVFDTDKLMKQTEEKLAANIKEKRENVLLRFKDENATIDSRLGEMDNEFMLQKDNIEMGFKADSSARKIELEKEIQLLTEKYEQVSAQKRKEKNHQLQIMQKEYEQDKANQQENLEMLKRNFEDFLASLSTQHKQHQDKIHELADHSANLVKRFENIKATASSILAAKNDWVDAQCAQDSCTAIDNLIQEVNNRQDSEMLPKLEGGEWPQETSGHVEMFKKSGDVVDIAGIKDNGFGVSSIVGSEDGTIVVSGETQSYSSHLTVRSAQGEKLQRVKIKSLDFPARRYCDFLTDQKVATVCQPCEIGVYDIKTCFLTKRSISAITDTWPVHRHVSCISVDRDNNNIIVGGLRCRDMYVFDERLKFIRTYSLPGAYANPCDIAVHGNSLLVCHLRGAFEMYKLIQPVCEMMYGLHHGEMNWWPRSVCIDNRKCLYILWRADIIGEPRRQLKIYRQSDGQLLATRQVDGDAECVTRINTANGDKVVVATAKTGKLYTYDLAKVTSSD